MSESLDLLSRHRGESARGTAGFAPGEIATLLCERCKRPQLPWELRTFGGKAICSQCFAATLELARGALSVLPRDEPDRLCSNCRAMRDPSLGSAWCPVTELGDERARICANFVKVGMESARTSIGAGRTAAIDVWRAASEELRSTLGESSYVTWFEQVEPLELLDNELILSAPNEYTRDWLEQRLQPAVRSALTVAGYSEIVPTYRVEAVTRETSRNSGAPDPRFAAKAGFNIHYTFAEFIVGAGNRLAHASALACIDKPGKTYNPLVLYGGVGVGKTHLLQAIGQEAIDQGKQALYVTSETFTNELISAIRDGSTVSFRERYRGVDYLLLDDVQFIAGKEATQEEFFHTFNALHQSGKQIVLSSDRPPSELRVLEARLRSRFEWGLTADMQPPDLETRMAIVRAKAALRGKRLPETVLNALAARAGANVRELEGALNRLLALSELLGTEPSMEVVRTVLGEDEGAAGSCRPADVLQAVAAYFRVKTSELMGQQRDRRISYARQMAMYLLREESKLSLVEIGHQLGGRNHSTVIYSCDKVAESRARGRVKHDIQAIRQLIYGVR